MHTLLMGGEVGAFIILRGKKMIVSADVSKELKVCHNRLLPTYPCDPYFSPEMGDWMLCQWLHLKQCLK